MANRNRKQEKEARIAGAEVRVDVEKHRESEYRATPRGTDRRQG